MENVTAVGIDMSKSVFHLHGVNRVGRKLFARKVPRRRLLEEVAKLPQGCLVYIEAGSGAHYWGKEFTKLGLEARVIAPQRAKQFLGCQKNDFRDAEAICTAGERPNQRFVPIKSAEQLKLQAIQRIREMMVRHRTALGNQIRGLIAEHGVVIPRGIYALKRYLVTALAEDPMIDSELRQMVEGLKQSLEALDAGIKLQEKKLKEIASKSRAIKRAQTVPGVGLLSATACASFSGNLNEFKNGRAFAACIGILPRQHSSGGKTRLGKITKRGDVHVRTLLIHGARTVIQYASRKSDPYSLWVKKQVEVKGKNRAAVAVANKNARILWRILTTEAEFDSSSLLRAA